MRRAALSLVIFISAFIFPSVLDVAAPPEIALATPSLSYAKPMFIPNGDFSVPGKGAVGTPPTNYDAETAPATVGTPPSNYDFETGDFTGWTVTGSPTVNASGPTGYYAQLGSGQKVQTAAFTVDSTAQSFVFDVAAVNSGTFQMKIVIHYGGSYASSTTKYITSCPSTCTSWNQYRLDAVAWQGQSIKMTFERYLGDSKVDNFIVGREEFRNWTASNGENLVRKTGGPSDGYVQSKGTLTSPAFTVDSLTQNGEIDLKVESGATGYSVKVLSGGSYSTSTTVFTGSSSHTSWGTRTFGLGDYVGQSVKVQVVPGSGTTVAVDKVGVAKNVVSGWGSTTTDPVSIGGLGTVLPYAAHVTNITSAEVTLDQSGYDGATRGNWVRVVVRGYENFNNGGTDVGSFLSFWFAGYHYQYTTFKENQAPLYLETREWIAVEFFVNNPTAPGVPMTGKFTVTGWGPDYTPYCNPTCGGRPDLASLEVIDGPGAKGPIANPKLPAMGLPPGLNDFPTHDGGSSDPVSIITGEFFTAKTDLAIPGKGIPLTWTRSYAANAKMNGLGVTGPMGAKWSHNWQAGLRELGAGNLVQITLPMGGILNFYKNGGSYRNPVGWEGSLVKNGGGDWTLTTASQLEYAFNSSGQWTSVSDRNGNTTSLTYSSGKLTTITDPSSRTFAISYDGDDRIDEVSDGTRSVFYDYNAAGDLIEITDVMGGIIEYEYDGHLLTQGTDANGNIFVRNTYDGFGRVIEQLDADDGLTTLEYSTPGDGATTLTDQRGKETVYYFDTSMRITDVVDHDGGTTTTVYDADGYKTSVTNALNETWSYTYDGTGNVLTATDPLSKVWTYTYNANNDVLTVTDPLSRVTTYTYDGDGNIATVTDDNANVTTFTVNGDGQVTEIEDDLGHSTFFGYDGYGNRTTVTNALSKVWTYTYDTFGRVTEVEDPLTHTVEYTYNAANLVLTAEDGLGNVTTYTYDDNGNVLTVEDALTNVTTYAYDYKDQLISITDAMSGVWEFEYDEVGNLLEKTNPRGKTTVYTYDDIGRLKTETDPRSEVRTYNYDIGGRLTSRVDPKAQEIEYTYNDRNELTRIDYPDTSYVSFAYNDSGARTQMIDSTGTTTYSYDDLYRLTSVTFPGSRTVSYGYDDVGRRTSITYPGGSNQVTYGYDNANRLTSVTDWNSNATTYSYDDAGRMTTTTLPSGTGIVSTYTYDNADRLTDIAHVKGGSTTVASVDYTLDDVGNRTQRVDQQGTHTYAYDDLHRLTSVTYPGPSTTTYDFDEFGNRIEMVVGAASTTYAYDDADRLTTVTPPSPASPVSYTWDDNGNLTDRGSDEFEWDYEDRMTSATVNSVTTNFVYRGDGLRDSRAVSGGATTTFTWDIAAGLPVVLDDGNQYVYGAGLNAMKQGGNWYYYLADGLGSTMAIVDSSGASQKSYSYDVYGEATPSGGLANEFDFAGQQTDGTGLQYLRARYYDPETGVFLSRDPMAKGPGWTSNHYAYVGGSAPNSSDPTGLCGWKVWECGDDVWNGVVAAGAAAGEALSNGASWTGDRIAEIAAATAAAAARFATFSADSANWLLKQAWIRIRAEANKELTRLALGAALAGGGSCSMGAGLFWVCTGVKAMDSINRGGMTFGNVYILGEKFEPEKLEDPSIRHEMKHADQWAFAGLATSGAPLVGQAAMAGLYVAVDRLKGGACGNFFEIWAGLSDGGYEC